MQMGTYLSRWECLWLSSASWLAVFAEKLLFDEFSLIEKFWRTDVELTQSRDNLPRIITHSREMARDL
jgi:hypothetical protein